MKNTIDPYFKVEVVAQTPNPQQVIWLSAHQCVCENVAMNDKIPSEDKAGEYAVKHLLNGNRGHYSPLEAPQISFNASYFPHSVMQQITRHRIGIHFSVQSFRYTGQKIVDVANGDRDVEEVFYLRPVGEYTDRQGKRYAYTESLRESDIDWCLSASIRYRTRTKLGFSEEHARALIPFDVRQHWVMSVNVRSLMHLLLIRGKKDAQLEAQQLCELMLPHFESWCPEIYQWFMSNLWMKGRLAP